MIEATAPLKRPVSAEKALAASEKLRVKSKKELRYPQKFKRRWGTVAFMAAIHFLTIYALINETNIIEIDIIKIQTIKILGFILKILEVGVVLIILYFI